jgi:hypothetical protein
MSTDETRDTRSPRAIRVLVLISIVLLMLALGFGLSQLIQYRIAPYVALYSKVKNHKWVIVNPQTLTWPSSNLPVSQQLVGTPAPGYTVLNTDPTSPQAKFLPWLLNVNVSALSISQQEQKYVLIVYQPRPTTASTTPLVVIGIGYLTRVPAGAALPMETCPNVRILLTGNAAAAFLAGNDVSSIKDALEPYLSQYALVADPAAQAGCAQTIWVTLPTSSSSGVTPETTSNSDAPAQEPERRE